ncbi:MAG: hypothetical protein ACR2RB_04055 [Gammaproteobacteria bacterium]
MNAQRRRSKKRSAASSKPQLKEYTIYIERNLGKYDVAECLREAGAKVEVHDDHLAQDAPDEKWISLVGRRHWVAITQDKNIRFRYAEKLAIIDHNARVLVVRAKNMTGKQKGEFLASSLPAIQRYANENDPPFIAGIDRSKRIRAYKLEE